MAITYQDRWEYAKQHEVIVQVQQAAVKAAIAVSSEAPETANHANRVAFALLVVRNPEHWARVMAFGVVSQLTAANPSDATVDGKVAAIWNAYAGVGE